MDAGCAKAFWLGALCAASLPVGAAVGLWLRPSPRLVAAVMAFGGGALLAALTLELVGPALQRAGFWPLAAGVSLGCFAFVTLNAALNGQGAFMRKAATMARHVRLHKRRSIEALVAKLSQVDILCRLPPEEIHLVVPHVRERHYGNGACIFRRGDPAGALYLVEAGKVAILREEGGHPDAEALRAEGETFGERSLLSGEPHSTDAVAVGDVRLWEIHKHDFECLLRYSPPLATAVAALVADRAGTGGDALDREQWRGRVMRHLDPAALRPSLADAHQVVEEHGGSQGAGLAIWLGACLDGIGESLVIGATTVGPAISLPLLGGVFVSNLPESMSSAATMRRYGARPGRVLALWASLVLVTGASAALGNALLSRAPHGLFAFFEGAAAGGMLAMTAETMLPEAFEHGGGAALGILTVAGFLAAIYIRSLGG